MSPETEPVKTPAQFQLMNLFVTKAIYEFIAGEDFKPNERPPRTSVNVEVAASITMSKDASGAFVRIDTKIIPDQKWQPYRIEVNLGVAFGSQNATMDELNTFCRHAAPSIMFPYIRETAHRLTMDAPGGPVRLDPMNISLLLNQTVWNVVESTDSVSTAPPPPPSQ